MTALLQSSTATILMTTSFVRQSMIGLAAAIAIVLGADLSTTLIAQVLSFDLSWLSPFLIITGFITQKRGAVGGKLRSMGSMIVGLGLILLSLSLLREAMAPLNSSPVLVQMLEGLKSEPILAILFSIALTFLMHSSLATILFYAAMASQGIIDLHLGILLVLGANIGSSLIPFAATYADGAIVRRVTVMNIMMRTAIVAIALALLGVIESISLQVSDSPARQIVNLHMGFSIIVTLVFLPIVPWVTRLGYKIMRDTPKDTSVFRAMYLDENALDKPTIALAGAARETLRMADLVQGMTEKAFSALKDNNATLLEEARETDQKLDTLFNTIKLYLTRLHHDALSTDEKQQVSQIMAFSLNLEHCGDLIQHTMSDTIMKRIETQDDFSPEGWLEIKGFYEAVMENMQIAQSVFISQSTKLASEMIETKKRLKHVEFESRRKHFNRLSEKQPQSLATSAVHVDLMRDLGRINSYMTAIAYETMNGPA